MPTLYMDNDPGRVLIKTPGAALNPMCEDCLFCGTNCEGTTRQIWTGCTAKLWNPAPQMELIGVKSRHGIHPAGLAQAAQATRTAAADLYITILYSETADAIKIHARKPEARPVIPSTYQYITTARRRMTAAEIIREIDDALDLAQDLPF